MRAPVLAGVLMSGLLLGGCAPTMAPLPGTATEADRARAEACHARAVTRAQESTAFKSAPEAPEKEWHWWEIALAPVLLAGAVIEAATVGVVAIATGPWMLASEHARRKAEYQRAYTACLGEPQAAVEPAEKAEKETR